jgi:hypothetical protein
LINSEVLSLSSKDLDLMRIEWSEEWENLFIDAYRRFSIES